MKTHFFKKLANINKTSFDFTKNILNNIKNNTRDINLKKFTIPVFSLLAGYYYFRDGAHVQGSKILRCLENSVKNENVINTENVSNKKNAYFIPNNPKIYIIYDEEKDLQKELVEMIKNKLKNGYVESLGLQGKINIEIISIQKDPSILDKLKLTNTKPSESITTTNTNFNLKNKNEPIILIKNDYLSELLNPYAFTKNSPASDHKLFTKLNNLITYKKISSLKELREEFRYLESPKYNIILITQEMLSDKEISKSLSLFRTKNTKILLIEDANIISSLSLNKNHIYKYYSAKLPYKMKDTDLFLQDHFDKKLNNSHVPVAEILTQEGVDLSTYLNSNSASLMIKYHMFRDEIKISKELIEKKLSDNIEGKYLPDRIKFQKMISYPTRNVSQLAETDKKMIEDQMNTPNKILLFIYVPNWSFLKENIFDAILFDSPHLFDKIQITNSKNFTFKKELYDDSQISEEIPQIYLIETNNLTDKKIYSMNYFRFADDFNKYIRNKKEIFKKPEVMENLTYVSTVNSLNFEEKVLKDNSFREFMIEVKHEGCPTCYMLGKMFDHVSQKFHKHKYDKKFKFFRVDTHNDIPHLGEFAATPTYLFCRKNEKGQIEMISQVDKQDFLFKIKKLSKLDLNKVRYHPNIGFGFYIYQKNEFMKDSYDPDIDISGFNI
jgi:hypothetical protein